jgi:hypothetical protein
MPSWLRVKKYGSTILFGSMTWRHRASLLIPIFGAAAETTRFKSVINYKAGHSIAFTPQ